MTPTISRIAGPLEMAQMCMALALLALAAWGINTALTPEPILPPYMPQMFISAPLAGAAR